MPTNINESKSNPPGENFRVRIRMYRQGLGDCFLLSFRKAGGQLAHVLIDCGVVLGTSEPGAVMQRVAKDIAKTTEGNLDVLVITHEHWDHLSGFDQAQARDVFEQIKVHALWLAWTEDPGNALANQLREEREKRKKAIKAAAKKTKALGMTRSSERMEGLLGFFGPPAPGASDGGETGGGTAGALTFLKKKREPKILETGGEPIPIPGVEGVRVYVLGPPMDQDALKKTNPSKGEGFELGSGAIGLADALLAAIDPQDDFAQPFAKPLRQPLQNLDERLKAAKAKTKRKKNAAPPPGTDGYKDAANQWRNIDDAWLAMGERLALQLDSATNNTSLVLAFEFEDSKDVLLFVGDAQAGNWRSWDERKWTVKQKDGTPREVTAADLLKRTIFYKVGHHGSHNATLKEKGLERMSSSRLAAVIPVDTQVAHEVKGWTHMPLPGIRKRLAEKCSVVFQSDLPSPEIRSGSLAQWAHSEEIYPVHMTNKKTKKAEVVRQQNLYTDCFL